MTNVPLFPNTNRSARTTVGAPPTTQPIELNEEWTSKVIPCAMPIAARSLWRPASVLGRPSKDLIVVTSMTLARRLRPAAAGGDAEICACFRL